MLTVVDPGYISLTSNGSETWRTELLSIFNIEDFLNTIGTCRGCPSDNFLGNDLRNGNESNGMQLTNTGTRLMIDGSGISVYGQNNYAQWWFYHDRAQDVSDPKLCVLNNGDLVYSGNSGGFTYSLIEDEEYLYQPVNGANYVGCVESTDVLSQDDRLVSENGLNQLAFENGSYQLSVNRTAVWSIDSGNIGSLSNLSIRNSDGSLVLSNGSGGQNPKMCITDSGDIKMYVDKEVGEREYTIRQWAASYQSDYSGSMKIDLRGTSFNNFATDDISKWNQYDVRQSNGQRNVSLKLKDVNHTADVVTDGSQLGVGYAYAYWLHPLVLAEEYTAYLLCYDWDSDENEADRFFDNIPPAKLELGPNGVVANFAIPPVSSVNRCLVEISANKEPRRVIFRKKCLHITSGTLSINEFLDFVDTNPPARRVDEIAIAGPKGNVSLTSDDIDQMADDLQKYEAANAYIAEQCAADPESKECKGAGTLLLRALGTAGSGLSVDYSNRCLPDSGAEIVDSCFLDETTPSMAAQRSYFEGSRCESDSEVDCTFDVKIYKDDFLGSDIDPLTLFEMKNLKITYYKATNGTIYVKNDCFVDQSKTQANGMVPFSCGYNKELTENAAKRYAELTRGATTNIILKRV